MTPFQAVVLLAKRNDLEFTDVIDVISRLVERQIHLEISCSATQEKLDEAVRRGAQWELKAGHHMVLQQTAESQCNDQHALLLKASALLTDWVFYNDNKKNADIALATHELLKEMP